MSLPSLLAFASVLGRSGRENQVLHPAIDLALRLFRVLPGAVAALAHSVFHGHEKKTDSETPIPARWLDRPTPRGRYVRWWWHRIAEK